MRVVGCAGNSAGLASFNKRAYKLTRKSHARSLPPASHAQPKRTSCTSRASTPARLACFRRRDRAGVGAAYLNTGYRKLETEN